MKINASILADKLYYYAKNNAPVRIIKDKNGKRPKSRAVGKPGTNMYSPYPGNLKNNGIVRIEVDGKHGVRYDYNKVGYIGYANLRSRKPQFIQKTVDDFCLYCVKLSGRIIRK